MIPLREECYEHAAKYAMRHNLPVQPLRVLHARFPETNPVWEQLYDQTGRQIYERAIEEQLRADKDAARMSKSKPQGVPLKLVVVDDPLKAELDAAATLTLPALAPTEELPQATSLAHLDAQIAKAVLVPSDSGAP